MVRTAELRHCTEGIHPEGPGDRTTKERGRNGPRGNANTYHDGKGTGHKGGSDRNAAEEEGQKTYNEDQSHRSTEAGTEGKTTMTGELKKVRADLGGNQKSWGATKQNTLSKW